VRAVIVDEVDRPHVVLRLRRRRPRAIAGDATTTALARHLKLGLAPQPVAALEAHREAVALHERADEAVAVARVLRRELAQVCDHGRVRLVALGLVVEPRASDAEERARAPLGQAARLRVRDLLAAPLRAHHFFTLMSFSTSSSRSLSASN